MRTAIETPAAVGPIDRTATRAPLPRGPGLILKRLVLGPALPTEDLRHQRLGKPTALAIFASDNLSSSAYATEEILKVGLPVVGAAAFSIVMPVTVGMLLVLAILLFSYRQTIKAYPSAGGAYVVTKDNFGVLPAQFAGVALLVDYVLTVAVSIAAGVAAMTSAIPSLFPYRIWLAVFFVWFIAWGNLRGIRESGRMFAVPTYFFILMTFTLIGSGVVRALGGDLATMTLPDGIQETTGAIGLFLALHAFASGGAAVTGVEAISNGVPSFRPPEWRNARTTLMWMGGLLAVMFVGLSFLAVKLHAFPTETQTLNSQIARAVFGTEGFGHVAYLLLQLATMLILILAANTSFAGFPQLASFQARDDFMPRVLTTRGRRLVYSNGIVGLAVAATALVVIFRADVHRLIPLYAVGVFASFTLSQAGMAKRHLRLREAGWRPGLLINAFGAATTFVVAIVIGVTKFTHGAWAVMLFIPTGVWLLVRMHRQYFREREELESGLTPFVRHVVRRPVAVVIVEDLDRKTLHALQYAKTIGASEIRAVHLAPPEGGGDLGTRWSELGLTIPLHVMPHEGEEAATIAGYAAALAGASGVTVIVPSPGRTGRWERLRRGRAGARLARALAPYPNVRLTLVRDHPGPGHPVTERDDGSRVVRIAAREGHRVLVLVDRPDRATLRAVDYALSLGAREVRAVHAAVDPDTQQVLIRRWMDLRIPIELDLVECWDRDVARTLERQVVEMMGPRSEITVVLPRRDFATVRQRVLHDRTSRRIARTLGRYEHVDIAVVPYFFPRRHRDRQDPSAPQPAIAPAAR